MLLHCPNAEPEAVPRRRARRPPRPAPPSRTARPSPPTPRARARATGPQPATRSSPDGYGDLTAPWAAIHSLNGPTDPRIADVVAAGHLVRTRADGDVQEPAAGDTTRRDAAIASGAHFVSTDFPEPHPETGYVVDLGGVACNPVTASDTCDPATIE